MKGPLGSVSVQNHDHPSIASASLASLYEIDAEPDSADAQVLQSLMSVGWQSALEFLASGRSVATSQPAPTKAPGPPRSRCGTVKLAMAGDGSSSLPVLSVSGLRRDFGDLTAVDGFDLDLAAGECIALIGHNGSGKTTALRVIAGRLEPTSGSVSVDGANVHDRRRGHVARAKLAFVPDTPVLYDDLTVGEHLELVGLANGVGDGLDDRIALLLERLGLTSWRDFLPRQLSRGMRQKTQIACAFIRSFDALLLDEPVVGLDPPSQAALQALLSETKQARAGVVFSTHQLVFAAGLADRAMVLHEGRVVDAGPFDRVARGPEATKLGLE